MPRGHGRGHGRGFGHGGRGGPGRFSRLVEPSVLYLLATEARQHGYELFGKLQETHLTDGVVDVAAVYRTLRSLEAEGCVVSDWQPGPCGPARRIYDITPDGLARLREWAVVLDHQAVALRTLADDVARLLEAQRAAGEGGEDAAGDAEEQEHTSESGSASPGLTGED